MKNKTKKFAAAFLAAMTLLASSVPLNASADGAVKIVALGDSITNGYSMDGSLIASYPQIVSEYYDAELVNFASDEQTSNGLLAQLSDSTVQSEVASADVVLITIGGNDIMQPVLNNNFIDASKYNTMSELIAAMRTQGDMFLFQLQFYLNSVMPDVIKTFNANVQEIENRLHSMTNAQIVIQTVYNPMDLSSDDTPLANSGSMTALSTNVHGYLEGKPDNTLYPEDSGINDIIRGLGASSVVDTFNTFADHSYFYTHINNVDVHPNSKGHLAIAASVIDVLGLPETGAGNSSLMRRAYKDSGAESTLAGISAAIDDSVVGKILKKGIGDVDADGDVTISDATAALKIYAYDAAALEPPITGIDALTADADSNGDVDISDATLILKYYAESAAGLFSGTFSEYMANK